MRINSFATSFRNNQYQKNNNGVNRQAQNTQQQKALPPLQRQEEKRLPRLTDEEIKRRNQKINAFNRAVGAIGAITIAVMVHELAPTRIPTYNNNVSEVAQYVNIPSEVLSAVNEVSEYDVLGSLRLPNKFDKTEKEIEKLEEKLEKFGISEKKRAKIEEELEILKERKALQDKMGVAYYDDINYKAYIMLNGSYLAQDVEYAWGINEGIVEKHNNLILKWIQSKEEDGVYISNSMERYAYGLVEIPMNELDVVDSDFYLKNAE